MATNSTVNSETETNYISSGNSTTGTIDNVDSDLAIDAATQEWNGCRNDSVFFIERIPWSPRGAQCRHPDCMEDFRNMRHRIVVYPGVHYFRRSADVYHIRCFEKCAPLLNVKYLDRIVSLNPSMIHLRGLGDNANWMEYEVSSGLQLLIVKWKARRGRLMDIRDGRELEEWSDDDKDTKDLLELAGSNRYQGKRPKDMSESQYRMLSTVLAPWQSDGPDDKNEWNLFEEFLGKESDTSLDDKYSLSDMLNRWETCLRLARSDDGRLSEAEKVEKAEMSEKMIRAMKRLGTVYRWFF